MYTDDIDVIDKVGATIVFSLPLVPYFVLKFTSSADISVLANFILKIYIVSLPLTFFRLVVMGLLSGYRPKLFSFILFLFIVYFIAFCALLESAKLPSIVTKETSLILLAVSGAILHQYFVIYRAIFKKMAQEGLRNGN